MEVKWFIEDFERDRTLDPLIKEIRLQGMQCEVVKYSPYKYDPYKQYADNECVIFYGSLYLAHQIQREKQWVPGAYCNFNNFECLTYYSHWGKYLLNNDYVMLPLMEFYRKRKSIYKWYGHWDSIFMRPNSGLKSFNGAVYHINQLEDEMLFINSYANEMSDNIIVIISTPKVIELEWRIVMVDKKVVAASQYKKNDKVDIKEGCDIGASHLASIIAEEEWQPDKAYVLDICKSNEDYYLLEANSFSCSSFYDCQLPLIVKSVSNIALKEWQEYQEI
jgi:hypothetical protein